MKYALILIFLLSFNLTFSQHAGVRVCCLDSIQEVTPDMYLWILDPASIPQSKRISIWRMAQFFQEQKEQIQTEEIVITAIISCLLSFLLGRWIGIHEKRQLVDEILKILKR